MQTGEKRRVAAQAALIMAQAALVMLAVLGLLLVMSLARRGMSTNSGRLAPASALQTAALQTADQQSFREPRLRKSRPKTRESTTMPDTTAPVLNTLSFSGTTGTLTWTETQSQPVQNGGSSFTATGAGGSSDPTAPGNGVFKQAASPNAFFDGETQWYNGSYYIYNDGNGYLRMSTLPNDQTQQETVLYGVNAPSKTSFPAGGWFTGQGGVGFFQTGAAPAPTFTPNAGTVIFDGTQGLTITGLSGGAVTISNVVTSGQATTFTTSRVIAASESGGTLVGAASAFCDSASPPNMTAAFAVPITSTMFGSLLAPRNLAVAVVY